MFADELTKQRDALIDEIQSVKQKEESERENLRIAHEEALKLQESELKAKSDDELQKGKHAVDSFLCGEGLCIAMQLSIKQSSYENFQRFQTIAVLLLTTDFLASLT
jgi:hypothetical protein